MINSAKEAMRVTDLNGTFSKDDPTYLQAQGYLVALNGPEVKALVGELERIKSVVGEIDFDLINDVIQKFYQKVSK